MPKAIFGMVKLPRPLDVLIAEMGGEGVPDEPGKNGTPVENPPTTPIPWPGDE